MFPFSERLRILRKDKGLTQEELGEKVGVSNVSISWYESGNRTPDAATLNKLADVLETSTDYLLGRIDGSSGNSSANSVTVERRGSLMTDPKKMLKQRCLEEINNHVELRRIPVLEYIKAGYDLYAEEQLIGYEYVDANKVVNGEYFFLLVRGDSMEGARLFDGMRVLVRRQEYVPEGKIGVIIINGDEATLKYVFYPDPNHVLLQAANPNFSPRLLVANDVQVIGQAIESVMNLE